MRTERAQWGPSSGQDTTACIAVLGPLNVAIPSQTHGRYLVHNTRLRGHSQIIQRMQYVVVGFHLFYSLLYWVGAVF